MGTLATAQYIADRACDELGLERSELSVGIINQIGRQSLSLLSSLGEDLVRKHDWQFLEATHVITGDGTADTFPLPDGFGRVVNQTMWASTNRMPMAGPLSPQEWGWVRFGIVSIGLIYRYRIIDNLINVFPTPANGEEIKFFFIKKDWVLDADGVTYKDSLDGPEDTPLFDRSLMIKGLKSRLWGQKGFDNTALVAEFNDLLAEEKAQSEGAPVICLSGNPSSILIDPLRNIPDGSW